MMDLRGKGTGKRRIIGFRIMRRAGPDNKVLPKSRKEVPNCSVADFRGARYDARKKPAMIELTEQQRQELGVPEPVAIDP
jgi:hypothetical protein